MGSAASAEIIPKEYLVINASPVPQPKVTPPFSSLSILLPAGLFTEKGLLNMPRTIGGWFPERRALPSLYWYQHLLREREMRCLLSAFLMANQTHRALSLHILYLTAIMCMPREDINNPTTLFEHPYFNLEGYETLALLMWGLQSHPGTGAGREQGLGCQSQLSRAFPWNSSLLGCGSTECCSMSICILQLHPNAEGPQQPPPDCSRQKPHAEAPPLNLPYHYLTQMQPTPAASPSCSQPHRILVTDKSCWNATATSMLIILSLSVPQMPCELFLKTDILLFSRIYILLNLITKTSHIILRVDN